jgi:hypothetical protein
MGVIIKLNLPGSWIPDISNFSGNSAMLFGDVSSTSCFVAASAKQKYSMRNALLDRMYCVSMFA